MSEFLKNPANEEEAKTLIRKAHDYAESLSDPYRSAKFELEFGSILITKD